ncbi:hypothetical protein Lal_00019305 [Lupinus albus]|uniref:Putative transcription regulator GNAT family n=1 Tax=Lupinus albus TaxID=3870 RepID=A0A6A5PP88_LUPAL|nr:putative transcription regulator GNAT family [Lupinus albus]KAF1899183.1 hypothetical protein Lal_00019305 [Lupinus albus]
MARLLLLGSNPSIGCGVIRRIIPFRNACYQVRRESKKNSTTGLVVQCNSSNSSQLSSGKHLVCEYGWRVRRLADNSDEIKKAAQLQAQAFHVPLSLFNHFFFQFFQAEVLSGLLYKLKNSPPHRYACLVAEAAGASNDDEDSAAGASNDDEDSAKELVGITDVTVLNDQNVLQHLPTEAQEYLYISGIAVSKTFRRRKIASALLKACDTLSILWGFEFLALRAYEDDMGARKLYANAGYQLVSKDPPWSSYWIGRKCRVLMIKSTNFTTSFSCNNP